MIGGRGGFWVLKVEVVGWGEMGKVVIVRLFQNEDVIGAEMEILKER